MRRVKRGGVVLAVLVIGSVGTVLTETRNTASHEEALVQRFLSRHDAPLTHYRAFRRLEASNDRFDKEAWIEALTELTVDGRFTYQILLEGGSEYVRNKVLRPFLINEAQLVAEGGPAKGAFTPDNYELSPGEEAEPGLFKLLVKPKRRDVLLVDGAVFISDEADLVRIEGRLSKNPSFWTKRVDIVRRYGRLAGVRVPLRLDSVAQVRMAGTSNMSMTYNYEMVNGIQVTDQNAKR